MLMLMILKLKMCLWPENQYHVNNRMLSPKFSPTQIDYLVDNVRLTLSEKNIPDRRSARTALMM